MSAPVAQQRCDGIVHHFTQGPSSPLPWLCLCGAQTAGHVDGRFTVWWSKPPMCECLPDGSRRWDGDGKCWACGRQHTNADSHANRMSVVDRDPGDEDDGSDELLQHQRTLAAFQQRAEKAAETLRHVGLLPLLPPTSTER